MSTYNVVYSGRAIVGPCSLEDAESRAKTLSESNASRYVFYSVEEVEGPNAGGTVCVYIRGIRAEFDQLPRVEVRETFVGANERPVAFIPVIDGDETWSMNAASVISLRMADSKVVLVP